MRAMAAVATLSAALSACSGTTTPTGAATLTSTSIATTTTTESAEDQQALECPTQPHVAFAGVLPASFDIMADSGVSTDPEGRRILSVVPAVPVEFTILVTVEPAVVLGRLWFGVQSVYGNMMWTQTAATHLPEGRFEFTFEVDPTGWPPGRHPLVAGMETERDDRDPCSYRSGATWGVDIGYLVVDPR
jgi:hypothetical protein